MLRLIKHFPYILIIGPFLLVGSLLVVKGVLGEPVSMKEKKAQNLRKIFSEMSTNEKKSLISRIEVEIELGSGRQAEYEELSQELGENSPTINPWSSQDQEKLRGAKEILAGSITGISNDQILNYLPFGFSLSSFPYVICGENIVGSYKRSPWEMAGESNLSSFLKGFKNGKGSIGALILKTPFGDPKVIGTAFVLKQGRVVTAGHVVEIFAEEVRGGGGWAIAEGFNVTFQFPREYKNSCSSSDQLTVESIEKLSLFPDDFGILKLSGNTPPPLEFGKAELGDVIVTIGYPVFDIKFDSAIQKAIYRHPNGKEPLFGVKRISGGKIREWFNATRSKDVFVHNATTVGGNSGSPIIRMRDKKVVGIHIGIPQNYPEAGTSDPNLGLKTEVVTSSN